MFRILALVVLGTTLTVTSNSWALTLDLSTAGASGSINGAYYVQTDPQPTGTGYIDSFVRIGPVNANIVSGYNTDYRPVQFDEKTNHTYTHSITISDIPTVTLSGTTYRQFLLDINQTGVDPLYSLDQLQIFLGASGDLHNYPSGLGTKIYDLDAGTDNWILLDYSLNSGSGSGDMFAYIPSALFTGPNQYVYLYSQFGVNHNNNDGLEEWAVLRSAQVPEPSALILLGSALFGLALWSRRRAIRR